MPRSDDIGTGLYSGGRYLSVWSMLGGQPRCVDPALVLGSADPAAVAAAIAGNRAVAGIAARAEAVEAAARLAAQEPPPATMLIAGPDGEAVAIDNPALAAWVAAGQLLADVGGDDDLQHMLRTRGGALLLDESGVEEAGWSLYLPPVPPLLPLAQTADWDGAAWSVRDLSPAEAASWPLQPPPVPAVVSRTQLRLVLAELPAPPESGAGNVLDFVDGVVAASGDRVLQERWAAERMERDSPYLIGMATGLLQLDSDGIDAIFRQAATK